MKVCDKVAYLNRALKENAQNFTGEKSGIDKDVEEVLSFRMNLESCAVGVFAFVFRRWRGWRSAPMTRL